MELDETSPCANFNSFLPLNRDILSIETGVQKMTVNDTDMLDSSDVHRAPENPCSLATCKKPIYHSSAEAFLQFEKERQDITFSRSCLFCRKHFTGNRSLLLEHFTEQHNFFIGQPDNLVYIKEFLDMLEEMLNKLQCLYCRKIFKDWETLKEHMRKKMHKRINSSDSNFDRFYMTNYLNAYDNMITSSPDVCSEIKNEHSSQYSDTLLTQDDEREIEMEPMDSCIICLYCDSKYFDFDEIMHHLKVVHNFDFKHLKETNKLSFYSQVKLINYIRRKVLVNECTICDVQCPSKEILVKHMSESGHITLLPDRTKWDQSEFFFSTLDTDYLLCGLEDDDEEDCSDDHARNYMDYDSAIKIFCEDVVFPQSSILTDAELRKSLL